MSNHQNTPASCAALAAQLIVEGCLPIIQGSVKGKTPIEPVVLTPEERSKLGLTESKSVTLFYPAGETGVFFDTGQTCFKVWFNGEDCENATTSLHNALMRAFPATQQRDDVAHPEDPRMRARFYSVDLGEGRLAHIATSFGLAAPGKHQFVADVSALQRSR